MTLMRVRALHSRPEGPQAIVVLETEAGDRALGFTIPTNEAARLARVLGLVECRCAPIFELLLELATGLGARVAHATVDAEEPGIIATLALDHETRAIEVQCHPADAVALALRAGAPIYATPAALARAHTLGREGRPGARDLGDWLATVRPSDFGPAPSAGA